MRFLSALTFSRTSRATLSIASSWAEFERSASAVVPAVALVGNDPPGYRRCCK